jgi:cytidyltransferase-like protein
MSEHKKIVITSGFFNPIHIGHTQLMKEARNLGDHLVVIVNNDYQVTVKGSVPFMPEQERLEIIKDLKYVDEVFLSVDHDISIAKSLQLVAARYPGSSLIFAKGGDRNIDNIPDQEKKVCQDFNITVVSNVGGSKVQSSSWLISKASMKL